MTQSKTLGLPRPRPLAASPGPIARRPQALHGLDAAGKVLHCGDMSVPLDAVAAYKADGVSEKDLSTAFATMSIFSAVAALMVIGVADVGWRARFLLEGALFGAIALCAGAEIFSSRRRTLYTFTLQLSDGRTASFVTADTVQARAVNAALAQTIGARTNSASLTSAKSGLSHAKSCR